jgi:hypothetical protein
MIIDHRKYGDIDYSKYKRVFMFGCSFTKYEWPSWANIIGFEMPNAVKYNFGQSGGGNLFISERIIAANQQYKFDQDDLILVMWSTHCREDRYIEHKWETPGNIFTQGFYPEEFVKKYSCVRGYMVRDLALMTMIKHTLTLLPCHAVVLKSVSPDYDKHLYIGSEDLTPIIELYKDTIYDMPMPLYESVKTDTGGWTMGTYYYWPKLQGPNPKEKWGDYHPDPNMYMNYLTQVGFKFSPKVIDMVHEYTKELHDIQTREELEEWANDIWKSIPNYNHSKHLI